MLGCSLIRPCFFFWRDGCFLICLLEYVDLLGKKPCWIFSQKSPRLKFHSENLSPPCMENTVKQHLLPTGWQLFFTPVATNLTSPNPLDIPRIRKPSSWIIAIRQGRQDDELSAFFSPWKDWMGKFCRSFFH